MNYYIRKEDRKQKGLIPIHLPLKDKGYIYVYVSPHKRYGEHLGIELIKKYGKKYRRE